MARSLTICALVALMSAGAQTQRDLKVERETRQPHPASESRRWALVVGVSSYKNAPPHAQLKFAHRDAEEFARFLRSEAGGSIPGTRIRVLTEDGATLSSIRAALHEWLPKVADSNDVVYFFFAGHGVLDHGEAYFVAHDSDPQNLHATGLSFREVNETLNARLKSGVVIVLADACHAGSIGWTADPESRSQAQTALESLGGPDRAVLKLLASAPSERSFEDERWDGGHGVFTYALLSGLRGAAEQERDGVVRASELIDYVSKIIPQETSSQQNPRVAGNFEPRFVIAQLPKQVQQHQYTAARVSVDVVGPAGTSVYLDGAYRGAIRSSGDLRLDSVTVGEHRIELELPDGRSVEQMIGVRGPARLDLDRLPAFALMRLESAIQSGNVLEPGGAWDYYRSQRFSSEHKVLADTVMAAALENIGQNCVSDYVQSTRAGLKAGMLRHSVEAFRRLQQIRPNDRTIEMKRTFCEGRALIAEGQPEEAIKFLQASLRIDSKFACAHNALGVALARLNRNDEAQASFERAFQLAPEWFLPPLQIAQQFIAAGQFKKALPLLEKAVKFNPRAPLAHWTLLRVLRELNREKEFLEIATHVRDRFPEYAPTYLEIAAYHESRGDFDRAAQAYDTYLTLAPNFGDSAAVKDRAAKARRVAGQKPTLLREK